MTPEIRIPADSGRENFNLNADQIRQAADALGKIRPAYAQIMAFYSRIFAAQADSRSRICLDPMIIEDDLLALKRDNDMPLISPPQFRIDTGAAADLMKEICRLAAAHAPKLAQAGENLATALDRAEDPVDVKDLFHRLLDGQKIDDLAASADISPEALSFFGFSAMAPSIQACSEQLSVYLKEMIDTDKSWCPVCGSAPNLSFLSDSGKRHVCCSLCSHIWPVRRMGCFFCGSAHKEDLHYFFSKEEPEYRVYCCNRCGRYLKTVDTRLLGRRFVPRLEQVATLHLDFKAKEQGYTPPGPGSGID